MYSAVCPACGHNQAVLRRLRAAEKRRQVWVPVLRSRVLQQRAGEEPAAPHDPGYGVSIWRPITGGATTTSDNPAAPGRSAWMRGVLEHHLYRLWVGVLIAVIVILWLTGNWQMPALPGLQRILSIAPAVLTMPTAESGSPGYALNFFTVVFFISLTPVIATIISWIVRRLVP
ncbi:MAG: hypothetical protein IT326_04810 [Anaerolineae bacterium]|nr:hypothetical protein [Anaerolineae bacterium]